MIVKSCKRDGCGGTFSSYPSQNKAYCSPECRYSDPALREILRSNYRNRHTIRNVDPENRRADCGACGPVDVRLRKTGRGTATWRCRTAERARIWAYQYGLRTEDVERLLAKQENKCAVCGLRTTLVVDHDHTSGDVRGLLCQKCNKGLGHFLDDPSLLNRAEKYLRRGAE